MSKQKWEIWKLQRPLFTNGSYYELMAYNEDRSREAMIDAPAELVNKLFGDEPKIYVRATVIDGMLTIDKRVEEQNW